MAQRVKKPKLIKVPGLWDNGNAFAILGKCKRAARKAGWSEEQFRDFAEKAKYGSYDHLLQTVMKHFDELSEDDADGDDE